MGEYDASLYGYGGQRKSEERVRLHPSAILHCAKGKHSLYQLLTFLQSGKVLASGNPKDINLAEAIASAEQHFGALQLDEDF